jgi:hypothetical protein
MSESALTTGVGLTVTVNCLAGPLQAPAVPVTLTVAMTAFEPVLVAEKAAMLPVPIVLKPTFAEDVQAKVVPVVGLPKLIAGAILPLQNVALVMALTLGEGLTVTVKVLGVPTQVLAVGVTDTVVLLVASLSTVV